MAGVTNPLGKASQKYKVSCLGWELSNTRRDWKKWRVETGTLLCCKVVQAPENSVVAALKLRNHQQEPCSRTAGYVSEGTRTGLRQYLYTSVHSSSIYSSQKVKGWMDEQHTGYILKAMSALLGCHVSFIRHATGLCKLVVYRERLPFLRQKAMEHHIQGRVVSVGAPCPWEHHLYASVLDVTINRPWFYFHRATTCVILVDFRQTVTVTPYVHEGQKLTSGVFPTKGKGFQWAWSSLFHSGQPAGLRALWMCLSAIPVLWATGVHHRA